ATGSSQLAYQWFVNGVPLYGVQNSQYTRSGAQPADAGLYTVSVTDAAGSTTSTAATVTVSPDTIPISFPPVDFGETSFETTGDPIYIRGLQPNQQDVALEWLKDGQVVATPSGGSSETPGLPADAGTYVQIVGNGAGAFALPPEMVVVSPANPANPWVAAGSLGGVAYFAFSSPAQIQRYDMNAGTWLTTVALSATPTAMQVLPEGVYVALGRTTYLFSLDLSSSQPTANRGKSTQEIFCNPTYVYLAGSSGPGEYAGAYTSINRSTHLTAKYNTLSAYSFLSGINVSPATGLAYGWESEGEPTGLGSLMLNADGTVTFSGVFDGPIYGNAFDQTPVIISPDGTLIIADTGAVYNASAQTMAPSLGLPITDACFLADGSPVALRGSTLTLYGPSNYFEEGSATIPSASQRVFSNGSTVCAFSAPSTPGGSIGVATVTEWRMLSSPRQPFVALFASESLAVGLAPDDAFVGTDGNLYLLDRPPGNILRWSPTQLSYLPSIPLTGIPFGMSYSRELNRIYVFYGDRRIKQINLASSLSEGPFATLGTNVTSILAAGDQLYVIVFLLQSPGNNAEYLFNSSGAITATGNAIFSDYFPNWDDATGQVFGVE